MPEVKTSDKKQEIETGELIALLKTRFEKNMHRHKDLEWEKVKTRLDQNPGKLQSLAGMEQTGGEPDVVGYDKSTGEFLICDMSKESPEGRRNTTYDRKAQEVRIKKGVYPEGNALDQAASIGIEILTEAQYREIQKLEHVDTKSSSWIKTPEDIRKLDGALFCDWRYGHVFVYHNSAPSFYSSRGFRGMLRV